MFHNSLALPHFPGNVPSWMLHETSEQARQCAQPVNNSLRSAHACMPAMWHRNMRTQEALPLVTLVSRVNGSVLYYYVKQSAFINTFCVLIQEKSKQLGYAVVKHLLSVVAFHLSAGRSWTKVAYGHCNLDRKCLVKSFTEDLPETQHPLLLSSQFLFKLFPVLWHPVHNFWQTSQEHYFFQCFDT